MTTITQTSSSIALMLLAGCLLDSDLIGPNTEGTSMGPGTSLSPTTSTFGKVTTTSTTTASSTSASDPSTDPSIDPSTGTTSDPSTGTTSDPSTGTTSDHDSSSTSQGSCDQPDNDRYIFVTQDLFLPGALDVPPPEIKTFYGVEGADQACQAAASAAKIGNSCTSFRAWIATQNSTPLGSFNDIEPEADYLLPDGTKVANSWSDLTDGTLLHSINTTEYSHAVSGSIFAWTNISSSGSFVDEENDCSDWTSNQEITAAIVGNTTSTSKSWTEHSSTKTCFVARHLYCIEVHQK